MLLADGATSTINISDVTTAIQSVLSAFTDNLTVGNIASVLGIVIGACLTLYLFYWGARKALRMVQSAFSGHGLRI